jgi:HK97 family phage major capsid protein/HK97 family phage prohead protease
MNEKIAQRLKEIQARGMQKRAATVAAIDQEARTVELAFSSETEDVERWYGIEVLGHDANEIDLTRLNNKAPVLWMHDVRDQRGVIEPGTARVDGDRIARCTVRFSTSEAGEQLFRDIVDGIVTKVSVGYSVSGIKLVEERDGVDVYRITSWQPYEVSMVSVAADDDVGVGRSAEIPPQEPPAVKPENPSKIVAPVQLKERTMTPEEIAAKEAADRAAADAARAAGTEAERARVRKITEAGERFGHAEMAREYVKNGKSVEEFRDALLEAQNKREQTPLGEQLRQNDVGLTDKESRSFSFLKVVRALADPTDRRAQEEAAFEFEAARAAAQKAGKDTSRFIVPTDVLTRAMNSTTGGATNADTGGYGIQNTLLTSSFIDILRNKAIMLQKCRVISGLKGTIDIPKQTAAAQAYWIGEDDDAGETGIGLGQITMSPKTGAAFSEITRKLLNQSSLDVEGMVRFDLATQMGLMFDKAVVYGIGSDHQPLGIANQTGIHAVPFAAAGQPTFQELISMETKIALDNADVDSMAYIANAGFRGYAKGTLKFPASASAETLWESGGTINGYATGITNQMNAGDVLFGNFADVLVGMWGALEMTVDPFSGSKKGRIRIVVFQDMDVAVRRTASFCLGRNGIAAN